MDAFMRIGEQKLSKVIQIDIISKLGKPFRDYSVGSLLK